MRHVPSAWLLIAALGTTLAASARAEGPPWELRPQHGPPLLCRSRDRAVQVRLQGNELRRERPGGTVLARTPLPDGPLALALTRQGEVVVIGLQWIVRVAPDGAVRWKVPLQPPRLPAPTAAPPTGPAYCGFPWGLALGPADEILVSCGYSLLQFGPTGQFRWQKWPVGNATVSPPLTDSQGRIFVSGKGNLVALSSQGSELWRIETWRGFPHPRHVGPIAWDRQGHLLFRTTMAGLHSPTDSRGVRRYYLRKPPELLRVSREGSVVGREALTGTLADDARSWPAHEPPPADCSRRMP